MTHARRREGRHKAGSFAYLADATSLDGNIYIYIYRAPWYQRCRAPLPCFVLILRMRACAMRLMRERGGRGGVSSCAAQRGRCGAGSCLISIGCNQFRRKNSTTSLGCTSHAFSVDRLDRLPPLAAFILSCYMLKLLRHRSDR